MWGKCATSWKDNESYPAIEPLGHLEVKHTTWTWNGKVLNSHSGSKLKASFTAPPVWRTDVKRVHGHQCALIIERCKQTSAQKQLRKMQLRLQNWQGSKSRQKQQVTNSRCRLKTSHSSALLTALFQHSEPMHVAGSTLTQWRWIHEVKQILVPFFNFSIYVHATEENVKTLHTDDSEGVYLWHEV